jgi:hypothetical protein
MHEHKITSAKIKKRKCTRVKIEERGKSSSAKNQGVRERESANAKARNLRPKKEREELPPGARKLKREA